MKKETIFSGRKVRLSVADVEMPDGSVVSREIVEHPGAVVILPLFDDGTVLLEDHYRFIVAGNLIEAPAGTLDPGEDPCDCAHRELAEETGLVAGELIPLGAFYSSPGVMTEIMYAYLARRLTRGRPALESDEFLKPVEVPLEEALRWAASGRIKGAKTIAALFLASLYLENREGSQP